MARLNRFAKVRTELRRVWSADAHEHVSALDWSPDGNRIAAAAISGPIQLFESVTGQQLHVIKGHGFGTTAAAWSASGLHFASAGQDGKVRFWDAGTGEETHNAPGGAAWVERLAWCPALDLLATAAGKKLRLWRADGQLAREYPDHPSTIADIQWQPGERTLASA